MLVLVKGGASINPHPPKTYAQKIYYSVESISPTHQPPRSKASYSSRMQANLQARQAGAAGARSCRQSLSTATRAPPTSRGSRVGLRAASGGWVHTITGRVHVHALPAKATHSR